MGSHFDFVQTNGSLGTLKSSKLFTPEPTDGAKTNAWPKLILQMRRIVG